MKNLFSIRAFVIFLLLTFVALFITQADPFVRSDGFYYFHTAKTLVNEANFVTTTKPVYWDSQAPWAKSELNGKYISVASPGTSILIYPALAISSLLNHIDFYNDYFIAYNGHTFFDGVLLLLNACFFFFIALFFVYKSLRLLKFSKKVSVFSITSIVISSYLLWYVMLLPVFTHVFEVCFMSILVYALLKLKESRSKKILFLVAVSCGFLFLIRPVYALIIAAALGYIVWTLGVKESLKVLLKIFIFSIPFIAIYFLYNYISYGQILASGYSSTRNETFDFSNFNGFNILFSSTKGWFVYSPIMLLSVIGLITLCKKNLKFGLFSLFSIFSLVITYGFWPNWWGGGSFGSRFLLFSVPLCAVGLAFFVKLFKNRKLQIISYSLITLFTIYSGSILLLYRVTYSNTDFNLPTYYFENQIKLIQSSDTIKDYLALNIKNIQLGSGFLAIATGRMDYVIKPTIENNIINFNIFVPPVVKQEIPKDVKGYLVNKIEHHVFEFTLQNPVEQKTLDCASQCNLVEVTKINSVEYSAIKLNEEYDLYLHNGDNIQLRGNTKVWDLYTGEYSMY